MRADAGAPGVTGLATYLPSGRMTSGEIAAASGLPEWVVRDKLGLHAKPVPGDGDHPTAMGVAAARTALERAGVRPEAVDVVISITEEYKEYPVWTAGIKLAYDLGADRAYAYDLGQKCGSGVLALKQARDLLVAAPAADVVLVAGGYRNGDLVDMRDPTVRFMYSLGAGAAAAVVQRGAGHAVLASHVVTDGSFSLDVLVPVGGTIERVTADHADRFRLEVADPVGMKARLERRSLDNFVAVVREAVRKAGATVADVAYLAMLHVKPSAHAYLLDQLGVDPERSIYLSEYGHLGQVDQFLSIELAAGEGRLREGDLVVLVAAGVGYVWNALCLRWAGAGTAGEAATAAGRSDAAERAPHGAGTAP